MGTPYQRSIVTILTDDFMIRPGIQVLDRFTSSGTQHGFNEDLFGWVGNTVWVVDGASALDATRHWTQTSGNWAAVTVHDSLTDASSAEPCDVAELVAGVVTALSQRWGALSQTRSGLLPPVASAALGVCHPDRNQLELAVVGDCVAVWVSPDRDRDTVLTDLTVAAKERNRAEYFRNVSLTPEAARRERVEDRMGYVEGEPGWVLSTNERVVGHVKPFVVEDPVGGVVLLATDGFAGVADLPEYRHSWYAVVRAAMSKGLAALYEQLRESVAGPVDDATAVLLRVVG